MMQEKNMIKAGSALMAVGTAAAVTAGLMNKRSKTAKAKKMIKKGAKTVDRFLDEVNYFMK
ncbi:MAG: hypothetical protein ACI4IF_05935 [Acutalibacteraceae bacterium]